MTTTTYQYTKNAQGQYVRSGGREQPVYQERSGGGFEVISKPVDQTLMSGQYSAQGSLAIAKAEAAKTEAYVARVDAEKKARAAEQQVASQAQQSYLHTSQEVVASLNASAERSGSPNRYLFNEEGGQVGLQTVQEITNIDMRQPVQTEGFGGTISPAGNMPGLAERFAQRIGNVPITNPVGRVEAFNVGLLEVEKQGGVLGMGAGVLLSASDLALGVEQFAQNRVVNAYDFRYNPAQNPDVKAIVFGLNEVRKNPTGVAEAGFNVASGALVATGTGIVSNPGEAVPEIVGQVLLGEAVLKGVVALKGEPLVTSEFETASKTLRNSGGISVEEVNTKGTLVANKLFGGADVFNVEARTVAETLQMSRPTASVPGLSTQEQFTALKVSGNGVTGEGAIKAELEIKSFGKGSEITGEFGGGVSGIPEAKKVVISGSVEAAATPFKEVYQSDVLEFNRVTGTSPLFAESGLQELEFPFKTPKVTTTSQVVKGVQSASQVTVMDRTVSKLGVDEKAFNVGSAKVELEVGRYGRSLNEELGLKNNVVAKETISQKTYPVATIGKTEEFFTVTEGESVYHGENFIVREPAQVIEDFSSVDTVQSFKAGVSEGSNLARGKIKITSGRPIDVKGYELIDLNKALGIKEVPKSPSKFVLETEYKFTPNKIGEGTASRPFETVQTEAYPDLVLEQQQRLSVSKATEASAGATVKAVSTSAVREIVKSSDKRVAGIIGRGSGASLAILRGKPVSKPSSKLGNVVLEPGIKTGGKGRINIGSGERIKPGVSFRQNEERLPSVKYNYESLSRSKNRNKTENTNVPVITTTPEIDIIHEPIIVIKPGQERKNEQRSSQELKNEVRLTESDVTPFSYQPISEVPKTPVFPVVFSEGKQSLLFRVVVGRPGNKIYFSKVGGLKTVLEARDVLKGGAAASVRVVPLSPSARGVNVLGLFGEDFYSGKSGDIVQKTQYRISSQGEKEQIPGEAARQRKSVNILQGSGFKKALELQSKGVPLRDIRKANVRRLF